METVNLMSSRIIWALFLFANIGMLQGQSNPKYQTFDFYDFDVELLIDHQINEENVDYLKSAITKKLQSQGMVRGYNPDIAVNIGVVIKEEVQTRETDYRDVRYLGQREYQWELEDVALGVYKMGTVTVELVDTKANKLVWEESTTNVIRKQKSTQKRIDKGVERLFKNFNINKLGS